MSYDYVCPRRAKSPDNWCQHREDGIKCVDMTPVVEEVQRMNAESQRRNPTNPFSLTESPDHWERFHNITTVAQLHEYLDACCERNVEKSERY